MSRSRHGSIGAVPRLQECRKAREKATQKLSDAYLEIQEANRQTIEAASQARDDGMGAQEIANELGISRQFLYQLAARSKSATTKAGSK